MSSLKRIAIIIPGGLGTGRDNMGVPVLEQIVNLLSLQFDVAVFQLYKVNEDYDPKGFQLFGFKSGNKFLQYFRFLMSFYRVHKRKKFEVVHGFWVWPCGFLAVFLGKIFKIKSITSVLGGDGATVPEINYGHLRNKFTKSMILWTLNNSNEANALTEFLAKNLYRAGLKRKLTIIAWGVNQNLFQFVTKPIQNPIQFLHIANLSAVKDQETLLRSFEKIQRVVPSQLTIIGEGTDEGKVKALISELDLHKSVSLQGQLPYNQLPSMYQRCDILLHTSLSEGQSEVVTEAMSCGLLVCGTHVGAMADLSDQCCLTVPLRDFQGLAVKVTELLNSPSLQNNLRKNAHEWASTHSLTWTVDQYKMLYETLAADRK